MEFKGTKFEWKVVHSQNNKAFNIIGTMPGGKYKIARCPYVFDERWIELSKKDKLEAEANALLISKAPEMLEMLDKCLSMAKALKAHIVAKEIEQLIKEATNV